MGGFLGLHVSNRPPEGFGLAAPTSHLPCGQLKKFVIPSFSNSVSFLGIRITHPALIKADGLDPTPFFSCAYWLREEDAADLPRRENLHTGCRCSRVFMHSDD